MRIFLFISAVIVILAGLLLWPQVDVIVSGLFYAPGRGFPLSENFFFVFMEKLAYYGARTVGIALALLGLSTLMRHKPIWGIDAKGWCFLFLALLLGPGLIANVLFKDHWGRARPREIVEFGGTQSFSPALVPQPVTHRNGSFISGDAAFGFYLPSFAYVMARRPRQKSKKPQAKYFFWYGMAGGILFGGSRIAMGAHFLSDVLFAMVFILATSAALHAVMFGRRETAIYWRDWFFYRA